MTRRFASFVARVFGVRKRPQLVALSVCPTCACEHAIEIVQAVKRAGEVREPSGMVRECVRCATRYTALYAGGAIIYGGESGRANGQAAPTGGAGDGRAGWLDDDLPELTLRG